jgi:predicted lipoprotein with Yx(FWY)xxD motif
MRAQYALRLAGLFALALAFCAPASAQRAKPADELAYLPEPIPTGFGVAISEIEGPVFTDAHGRTLYRWPLHGLRNGDVGDRRNAPSNCTSEVYTVNSGLMSPYPPGLRLPDAATRKSCQEEWPPVIAGASAAPVGKWSIIARKDGAKQWAYDGFPLYTSVLDKEPGDTLGGTNRNQRGPDGPGRREPVGPHPNIPPAFDTRIVGTGLMLVNTAGFAVYSWDGDGLEKSNCNAECLKKWSPVLAAETSQPQGEWTIIQRSPGVRQWAFRKKPVYTYIADNKPKSMLGSDEPGWHNVYTQRAPAWPAEFKQQETHLGLVLADSHGKTIYVYSCGDDALDQQICDHPSSTQAYRLAVCGGGDAGLCLKTWPPVVAAKDAKAPSRSWTAIDIDPLTGHYAKPGQPGAMHVWAFRGRPVYTFADERPGDVDGDAWGEFYGFRNGFKAFWLRDDFFTNAG